VSLGRLLAVAWIGFLINFASGAALFSSQATSYVTNVPFLIKIGLVLLGAIAAAQQQTVINRNATVWAAAGSVPGGVRLVAVLSIIFWIGAIITGRLIAYL
jgi:hypothetical protein